MSDADYEAPIRLEAAVAGLLALAIADREVEESSPRRTEVILSDAGLSNEEIGLLMGKQPDAVRMVVSRHRKRLKG